MYKSNILKQHPKCKKDLYRFGNELGSGTYSTVYQAEKIETKELFAIKVFPKSNLKSREDEERFQREIDAMAYLKYDNLVSLHDFFWDEDNFYLVADYCQGGELYDYIIDHGKLNEPIAALIFKQIVGAVAYCHSFGVAHRDLKPENILFTKFPTIKITDFGICGYISQEKSMNTFCGSPCYCSPECLCRFQYDGRLSDIWSLGVILYSMVTAQHPWTVTNSSLMFKQIMSCSYNLPDYLSNEVKDLITSLLKVNPQERMPLDEVLKHPWINFSEWALVHPPENLDLSISSITKQPVTLEQISSSSSRSSQLSDHGIFSPFGIENSSDGHVTDEDDRISLDSLMSRSHISSSKQISSSLGRLLNNNPVRRRYNHQFGIQSRGKMASIWVPHLSSNKITVIKELPQENAI